MSTEGYQVPLVELLEMVPADARLAVDEGPFQTTYHPVGRLCHEAASLIRSMTPAVPAPPEADTESERRAFAFGWWKALEYIRLKQENENRN